MDFYLVASSRSLLTIIDQLDNGANCKRCEGVQFATLSLGHAGVSYLR